MQQDAGMPQNAETPILKSAPFRVLFGVLFVVSAAAAGSLFADATSDWYKSLVKPALLPPGFVFSIVWTALYALIAISLSLVVNDPKTTKGTLFGYAASLLLSALWPYVFFEKRNPAGAFFIIAVMIIIVLFLLANVYRINKTAAYLLIPYFIWLWFALYLNYEIVFFN